MMILKKTLSALVLTIILSNFVFAQQPARDFSKENARTSPDWVKDAVIYEIYPRAFSQKGDFNSITADLDRLKNLGVTVLWLMPVHPIGQAKKKGVIGSPYAVKDFYAINPDYGSAEDLKRLVAEAHKRGLKVIIDIVANHTAWDSVMMKNPAFYTKNENGEIIPPVPDWADVADLNYNNPELRAYIIEMLKMWIRDYDLDGFRCDVAGFVPTDFWETARAEVDKIKPDAIWLAEWESPDLLVKAFDLDYSWANHSALSEVLQGSKPATEIRRVWAEQKAKFPKNSLRMRFSDNHDERRAVARFGEKGALAAQALVFTMDGVPMFYNGMEVGDVTESGAPALFEKLPVFWQIKERRPEFPKFYQQMIALRKNSSALRRGDLIWFQNSDEERIVTFARTDGSETIFVAVNFSNRPFRGKIYEFEKLHKSTGTFEEITPDIYGKRENQPLVSSELALTAFEFRIFRLNAEKKAETEPVLKRKKS